MRWRNALLALVGGVACAHVADVYARARAIDAFIWSPERSLHAIDAYAPRGSFACAVTDGGDVEALTQALITVESFATPRLQAWATGIAVRVAATLGMDVPDLTYGPGRVRLSTAARLTRPTPGARSGATLALRLLDGCETKKIVTAAVVDLLPPADAGHHAHLDLTTVRRIAAVYNGQVAARTPAAAIAHETYNRLVYVLFQHYRFAGLRQREQPQDAPSGLIAARSVRALGLLACHGVADADLAVAEHPRVDAEVGVAEGALQRLRDGHVALAGCRIDVGRRAALGALDELQRYRP
jgi:hypothetical protein